MRVLKFRAWDEQLKKMFYDLDNTEYGEIESTLDSDGTVVIGAYDTNEDWYELKPLQFTGLHDKNGKEIYEGDIISDKISKKVVEYNSYYKSDDYESIEGIGFEIGCESDEVEVIGNIYENPKLLTQSAETKSEVKG